MKTIIVKRMLSVATALMMVLGSVFVTTGEVSAASKIKLQPANLWVGSDMFNQWEISYSSGDDDVNYDAMKLVSVKSSNKKVIKVKKLDSSMWGFEVKAKRTGKSKITVTYKYKGKKYNTSAMYKVKKYPAPIKNIKVNGKKVNLKKNNEIYFKNNYKSTRVKLQYKLKAGWKIDSIFGYYGIEEDPDEGKEVKIKKNAILKGTTVKFPKKYDWFTTTVYLKNKKGEEVKYAMQFNR